jgi:hypothetical protein
MGKRTPNCPWAKSGRRRVLRRASEFPDRVEPWETARQTASVSIHSLCQWYTVARRGPAPERRTIGHLCSSLAGKSHHDACRCYEKFLVTPEIILSLIDPRIRIGSETVGNGMLIIIKRSRSQFTHCQWYTVKRHGLAQERRTTGHLCSSFAGKSHHDAGRYYEQSLVTPEIILSLIDPRMSQKQRSPVTGSWRTARFDVRVVLTALKQWGKLPL